MLSAEMGKKRPECWQSWIGSGPWQAYERCTRELYSIALQHEQTQVDRANEQPGALTTSFAVAKAALERKVEELSQDKSLKQHVVLEAWLCMQRV